MADHDKDIDTNEEMNATPEELAEAARFRDALASLERGRRGLDDLPNLAADDELADLVVTAHALRASGPRGELSTSRRDAIWDDLDGRLERAAAGAEAKRPKRRWWMLWSAVASAAAAALLVVLASQAWMTTPSAVDPPPSPDAVAGVDARTASYAARVMTQGNDPVGDTRLRDYRAARFEAWQADATWRGRYPGARNQR